MGLSKCLVVLSIVMDSKSGLEYHRSVRMDLNNTQQRILAKLRMFFHYIIKYLLRGCQRAICFLLPTFNIFKTHLRRTIFSVFINNLGVKSRITLKIKNYTFGGMIYRYYILLLIDFVFDFQNKQKNVVHLYDVLIVSRRYFIDICHPSKILFSIFFVILGNFTLKLLKNIEKMIRHKCFLSVLSVGQKTNSPLTSS